MKKLISIVILLAMVTLLATTVVRAEEVTTSTLADELYSIGEKYGVSKAIIERMINEVGVSNDTTAEEILKIVQDADQIMKDNNTTNFKTLPADVKAKLRALANEAAAITGVTLDFKSDRIDVYKSGKLIEALQFTSNGRLAYTGSDELANEIYAIGSKYGLTESSKVEIERFVKQYKVTDEQAEVILAKAKEAAQVLENAEVTDLKNLTPELKNDLVAIANEAADIVGAKLTFKNDSVVIVGNDGKVFTTVTLKNGVLAYTGADTLAEELYKIGEKYGLTEADKVRIERFVTDNKVTDEQAEAILAKAKEAAQVLENAEVTDLEKLTPELKSDLVAIANEAADIVGVKLTFKNGSVEISKDGKLIETVSLKDGRLAYTGVETNNVALIVSSIVVIALAATAVTVAIKKRLSVNA